MREVWYPSHNKEHKALVIANRRKRTKEIYTWINKLKAEKGCADCGTKDPRVLDFDHTGKHQKQYNISDMVRTYLGKETILKEIKKCEIRCANCHRIKTILRRN